MISISSTSYAFLLHPDQVVVSLPQSGIVTPRFRFRFEICQLPSSPGAFTFLVCTADVMEANFVTRWTQTEVGKDSISGMIMGSLVIGIFVVMHKSDGAPTTEQLAQSRGLSGCNMLLQKAQSCYLFDSIEGFKATAPLPLLSQ